MKQILFSCIISILIFSCGKTGSVYTATPTPCNTYDDSATISIKIIGLWKLRTSTCWKSTETPADKNIQVNVVSNGTYTVTEKTVVVAQGNWKLKSIVTNQWIMDLTVPYEYLNGFILFCNNKVSFADGYRDGCNSFFDKIN